jgi:hypothetical protein
MTGCDRGHARILDTSVGRLGIGLPIERLEPDARREHLGPVRRPFSVVSGDRAASPATTIAGPRMWLMRELGIRLPLHRLDARAGPQRQST